MNTSGKPDRVMGNWCEVSGLTWESTQREMSVEPAEVRAEPAEVRLELAEVRTEPSRAPGSGNMERMASSSQMDTKATRLSISQLLLLLVKGEILGEMWAPE